MAPSTSNANDELRLRLAQYIGAMTIDLLTAEIRCDFLQKALDDLGAKAAAEKPHEGSVET